MRYSLRTLLIVLLLAGPLGAWGYRSYEAWQARRRAARRPIHVAVPSILKSVVVETILVPKDDVDSDSNNRKYPPDVYFPPDTGISYPVPLNPHGFTPKDDFGQRIPEEK